MPEYMDTDNKRLARQYRKRILWITAGLTLVALLLMRIYFADGWIMPICISASYTLVCSWGLSYWRQYSTASHARSQVLTHLFVMSMRLILAAIVVVVGLFLLRDDKPQATTYVLVFAVYYLVALGYDTYFITAAKGRSKTSENCK